jgi:hypothetical protein
MSEYYVYIIAHSDPKGPEGPVKVGITKSLAARLASIQTGNWRRVEIVHAFRLQNRDVAVRAERGFHEGFAENRMAGEWFGIEPFDALEGLCNVLFGVLDECYPDEGTQARERAESGLDAKFKTVTDFYWGPRH